MTLYDPLSQRDARWSGQRLGTCNGITIGSDGCFVTAATMIARHYGHDILPNQLDDRMTNEHRYIQGCEWPDNGLPQLFPDIQMDGIFNYAGIPADLSKMFMDDTQERLIVIDFDHNPNDGIQTHALRVFSWDGHTLIVDDPWYGTRDNFSLHYGTNPIQTIQKIVGYKVPAFVPPWKKPSPPPDPRDQQIAALTAQLGTAQANYQRCAQLAVDALAPFNDAEAAMARLKSDLAAIK